MLASRLRVAACAGLLSTGLLIASSGGAVALADPDSGVSSVQAPEDGRGSGHGGPAARVTDTLRKAVQDMAGALTGVRKPGQPHSTVANSRATGARHARTPGQRNGALPTVADTPILNATASTPTAVAPVPTAAASAPNVADSISDTLVTSLDSLSGTVADVVAAVPIVGAPASDVIRGVQDIVTMAIDSVGDAAASPPSLPALMGVGSRNQFDGPASINAVVNPAATGASTPVEVRVAPSPAAPLAPPSADGHGVPDATIGVAALHVSGRASLPRTVVSADGALGSFLGQAFREIAAHLSLAALAAAALPGLGGLLILTAAGIRIGYRQAKASLTLHTRNLARFTRQGPIGIVRSGSSIAVRVPSWRVINPVPAEGLLEQVA